MLDFDLAALYDVDTRRLKEAVRRNIQRFPSDFMYELTQKEYQSLRSQFATLKRGHHAKYLRIAVSRRTICYFLDVVNRLSLFYNKSKSCFYSLN